MKYFAFVCVLSVAFLTTISCKYPNHLPNEISNKFVKGKNLDKVWSDPSFRGRFEYRVNVKWHNSKEAMEYQDFVKNKLYIIENPGSSNELVLYIRLDKSPLMVGLATPGVFIDGIIYNKDRRIIAAFTNERLTVIPSSTNLKNAIEDSLKFIHLEFNANQ